MYTVLYSRVDQGAVPTCACWRVAVASVRPQAGKQQATDTRQRAWPRKLAVMLETLQDEQTRLNTDAWHTLGDSQ